MGLSIRLAIEHHSSEYIAQEIFDSIRSCRLVIADCTGANPNVLYEIGLAHAIGTRVLLLTKNLKDVPFDIRHLRHLKLRDYSRGALPRDKLENAIEDTIRGWSLDDLPIWQSRPRA